VGVVSLSQGTRPDDLARGLASVLAQVPDDVLPARTITAELDTLREVIRKRTAALAAG